MKYVSTLLIVLVLSAVLAGDAMALSSAQAGVNAAQGTGVATNLFGNAGIVTQLTNVLLFIVGALSVIMLIFGGLRYVVSAGNASAVTAAKNTILYAIVGLVIAFLAYAIINFVMSAITGGIGAGSGNNGFGPTNL